MEDFQEIGAIWRGEIVRAVKSGRAIALVALFLMAEALLLTIVGYITSNAATQLSAAGGDTSSLEQKRVFLAAVTNYSAATIESVVRLPFVLLIAFAFTAIGAPLLIALMGFDQLAGEIAPKSMRYLIVRARRNSIIMGKWLTQITLLSVILALCVVAMVGTTKYLNADFTWVETMRWAARLTVALVVVGVAYASLTTLCSAVAGNSALALFMNVILFITFWFVSFLGKSARLPGGPEATGLDLMKSESPVAFVRYLVPSEFEHHLLSPEPFEYGTGLLAYIAFALIFLGIARLALQNRDL
jgi:ABC-2 type transport system permease protein